MARRAVFLDRDGVINAMVYNSEFGLVDSPANPNEFELLPGAAQAIQQINRLGLLAIVVSNQPGIAKGKFAPALLQATTDKMHRLLAQNDAQLDAVYYCLHHPHAALAEYRVHCNCRKPLPGLLYQAAHAWDIALDASYLVGDGFTDIQAGQAAGVQTFFICSPKCYICSELERQNIQPDHIVGSLLEAVEQISQETL